MFCGFDSMTDGLWVALNQPSLASKPSGNSSPPASWPSLPRSPESLSVVATEAINSARPTRRPSSDRPVPGPPVHTRLPPARQIEWRPCPSRRHPRPAKDDAGHPGPPSAARGPANQRRGGPSHYDVSRVVSQRSFHPLLILRD